MRKPVTLGDVGARRGGIPILSPGNFLFGWVLGYGGEATIEGPPDVVEQLQRRVEELQKLYA